MFDNDKIWRKDYIWKSKKEYRWIEVLVNPYIIISTSVILQIISVIVYDDKIWIGFEPYGQDALINLVPIVPIENSVFFELIIFPLFMSMLAKFIFWFANIPFNDEMSFWAWVKVCLFLLNIMVLGQLLGLWF